MAGEPETLELTLAAASKFFGVPEIELRRLSRRGTIPQITDSKLPWIETTRQLFAHLSDPGVTQDEAGMLISKSREWIRKLLGMGYIQARTSDGLIRRDDVFQGYIRFLTDDARQSARNVAENRIRDARARDIEMRTALRARELCETEDAVAAMEWVTGKVRSEFGGIAARITRDLVERRRIDKEITEALNRIAAACAAESAALKSGVGADVADGGDPVEAEAAVSNDDEF